MLLALDVGNTNIVIGFLDESGIRNIARLETDRDKTAHEYAISLRQVIEFSGIAPEDIDEKVISESLYTGAENGNVPDPDLIIRTSGEIRLSNFLPWQAAYSELYFTDVMWPDFGEEALRSAVVEYSHRHRRFGGV